MMREALTFTHEATPSRIWLILTWLAGVVMYVLMKVFNDLSSDGSGRVAQEM